MTRLRAIFFAGAATLILLGGLAFEIVTTRPVRGALRAYTELLTVANRPDLGAAERLDAVRALCSRQYLQTHPLALADESGIVGLPRNIHKNFRAWREGENVWICPTNRDRARPIYQFVFENGGWRFDGPIGILGTRGEIVPMSDLPDME